MDTRDERNRGKERVDMKRIFDLKTNVSLNEGKGREDC